MVLMLALGLVGMVRLKVGIWVMYYIYKSSNKDRNNKGVSVRVCECVCV